MTGNAVVIKPSEFAPRTIRCIRKSLMK
ncbi:hypothetical protein ACNKHM_27860 [Shigella sonnei]